MNNVQKLIESKWKTVQENRSSLVNDWDLFISTTDRYMKENYGRSMTLLEKNNVAQCLENALGKANAEASGRLFETTDSSAVAFLGVQLPIIAALLPSLVMNEIGVVQALDRRTGAIFYWALKAGTTKGGITAGDTLIDAKTGHARTEASRTYAMAYVTGEVITDESDTDSTDTTLAGTLTHTTPILDTVVFKNADGTVVAQSNSTGTVSAVNDSGVSGTVSSAGVWAIDLDSVGLVTGSNLVANYAYRYDQESGDSTVPEMDMELTDDTIAAIDFPLRTKFTLSAALDLQKMHGLSLENEMIKFVGGEIKFAIDHFGIDQIVQAAKMMSLSANSTNDDAAFSWDASVGSGQQWIWTKRDFINIAEKTSNAIFAKTLRAMGTYILCGNDVARVVRQLDGSFKPASGLDKKPPTGPCVIGTLDNRTIVQDPFMTATDFVMGYKGSSMLEAGFIYAPYIPLLSTPTITTSDLKSQKGFLSSQGFKIVNQGMFAYGNVTGLN